MAAFFSARAGCSRWGPPVAVSVRGPNRPVNTSRANRSEYERRMHRVLEHIDRHLEEPLDLGTLAEVAHFSPFHFHRLFSAWMGERLGDYLRRRRIEVAAMRLVAQPRVPVLHIALAVGFGSAEAFARAFRARFGRSPTAWRTREAEQRAHGKPGQAERKISQAQEVVSTHHGASHNPESELAMNVKLVDRQPATVAYLRHLGPYGEPISQFWQKTVAPWLVTNGLLEAPRYGISHDDPSITAPEQCRYDAGAEVPPQFAPTGNAFKTIIPGGRYAVLGFKGSVPEVGAAWTALLRDWLPASGLQLDARPCFEYYPKGSAYDPATGVFECEICIPVVTL
jgi:AraC family transcriptional regulator